MSRGPYLTCRPAHTEIAYIPEGCIAHLFTLLGSIAADSAYIKNKRAAYEQAPYSFHVKKALDYIDARYNEDLSLDDMCHYLNLSKSYFCSMLKKETGQTFSYFVNRIRLEKGKALLANEQLSVLDVSLSVGFSSQAYFNVLFKKFYHTTPMEYRRTRL